MANDLIFHGQFIDADNLDGETGLTVTIDVYRTTISDGTTSQVVTDGSCTETGGGIYRYRYASADLSLYHYVANMKTASTDVAQKHVAALGLVVPDALVSSRLAPTDAGRTLDIAATGEASANVTYSAGVALSGRLAEYADLPAAAPTAAAVADAVWDEAIADHAAAGSTGLALTDVLEDTSTTLPSIMAACASVAANSTDATASGAITRKRGNSWSIALTLGEVTGYTSLWFTIKRSYDDADSAALLQVKLNSPSATDGLLYVNGAAATDATKASITVSNAATGAIVIAVDETITDDLAAGTYYYDAQMLNTGAVTTPDSGTFTITADVTRSVA